MTYTEMILTVLCSLFGAKEVWQYLRHRKDKDNEVKMAQIKSDHESIEKLRSHYSELKAKFKVMDQNYKELKISFSVMLPALEKLVADDPTLKASFDVMKKYFTED